MFLLDTIKPGISGTNIDLSELSLQQLSSKTVQHDYRRVLEQSCKTGLEQTISGFKFL
jgi:hypothetical protein